MYHCLAEAESMATGEGSGTGKTVPSAPVSQIKEQEQVTTVTDGPSDTPTAPPIPAENPLPEFVPYVLIGAGTASFACMKVIREKDPNAKVFQILFSNSEKKLIIPK